MVTIYRATDSGPLRLVDDATIRVLEAGTLHLAAILEEDGTSYILLENNTDRVDME